MRKVEREEENFSWGELLKAIWYFLDEYRWKYLLFSTVLFIVLFNTVVPPFFLGKIVDFFTNYSRGESLAPFYIYTLVIAVTYSVASIIRLSTKRKLGNMMSDVTYSIKVKGFEKLTSFSLKWHDDQLTGGKAQRIQNGINALSQLRHNFNNAVLQALASSIGVVAVFIFLNVEYVIFFLLYILGFSLILRSFYIRIKKSQYEYQLATEKAGGSYIEGLSNILTIKTLGANKSFKKQVAKREKLTRYYEYKLRRLGVGRWIYFQVYNGLSFGIYLFLVGRGVVTGDITPGLIIVFFGYLAELKSSAGAIFDVYQSLIESKAAIGRIIPIFWEEEDKRFGTKGFPKIWEKLSIINGAFRYRDNEESRFDVEDVNFEVKKYAKVGVVGRTGSGKSTLTKLLVGLYRLDKGKYLIGKRSFYDIKHTNITDNIALVLQDSEMFNLSLKENITLLRSVDKDLLAKAIKIAQLDEVIEKLPLGLDTLIGEKGYHLSGGERQRVGIARAIIKDPQIMIFDEATSSLDSRTEKLIYAAIENKLKQKTIIFIAHRVTSLKNVDFLYVFKDGLSNEESSEFFRIYRKQSVKT
jgi:ABC-type multidrug transport system fused ATPase/permease subunit